MRLRKLFIILIFGCMSLAGMAQKKQMSAVREQLKIGKDLKKAESSLRELLKDSVNRENKKIWLLLCEVLTKQYEIGNEKLYLKQKYDTAQFFSLTRRIYETMQSFDSLDARPDARGISQPKFRYKHAEFLNSIRPNLFNGGTYFIHRKDYVTAYDLFDIYIESIKQPLLSWINYGKHDALMPHAAYWTMYCGYKINDARKITKHMKLAERDSSMLNFVRQYEADAFLLEKDTANYIRALRAGFEQYPNFAYFFPRLLEYYSKIGERDSAMMIIDRALEADSTSVLFRFSKSTALLNIGRYAESIDICKRLIGENKDFAEGYYNIGLAYFNQAVELDKVQQSRSKRARINELYAKAQPYIERYREFAPEKKDKWLPVLYTIYLSLNKGKEFDEIEKIRNGTR